MQACLLRLTPSQIAASLAGLAVFVAATFGSSAQSQQNEIATEVGFSGIEGPAVDTDGALYFVHYVQKKKSDPRMGKISRLMPGAKKSELYAAFTEGSVGNGIRFDKDRRMYVADYKNHNVLVFEHGRTKADVYFPTRDAKKDAPKFNQPNDLAIDNGGTLYASDPVRTATIKTGQIWRITRGADGKGHGEVMTATRTMGVTNGIDLSPDGKTLYVGESTTGQIWAYRIDGNNLVSLTGQEPMATLAGGEVDGMRTDASGRIYVTQNGAGRIAILTPFSKDAPKIIPTLKSAPSNLTFGGPDGKTVFVTQAGGGGFIEKFRVDVPGREFCKPFTERAC
jgi:signal peptidase